VVVYITYGAAMVAVLIGRSRQTIPQTVEGGFSLGRYLLPLSVIGLAWSILVILFFTVPSVNHVAAEYALYFEVAGVLWYVLVLRRRLKSGAAGLALASPGRGLDTQKSPGVEV
jgi:hypothetical protein